MPQPPAPPSPAVVLHRRRRPLATSAVLLTATLAFGLGACSSSDDDDGAASSDTSAPTTADTTTATTAEPDGDSVAYEVDAIEYADVAAPAGGTIDITNTSRAAHTFTADDDRSLFDVAYAVDQPATVAVPAQPGEYPFHCDIHPGMEATLTVE